MRTLRLPGTTLEISTLCLSAANFGLGISDAQADRLVQQFLDAGGNFLDSAHVYCVWMAGGDGSSERGYGALLRRLHLRDRVVLSTKGGHPSLPPQYTRPDGYLSAAVLQRDIEESLQRLGADTIDLYYLHRDDHRVPVGEIMDALNAEITRGRLRALGASNWRPARIAAANQYAAAHGLHGFVASQPLWNLAQHRAIAPDDAPDPVNRVLTPAAFIWHTVSQVPVVPYSPTACGYFAGRAVADYDNAVSAARRTRATALAAELHATPTQVALAWLLHQPFPVCPILGTTNPDHLTEALAATTLALTPAQVHWLAEG